MAETCGVGGRLRRCVRKLREDVQAPELEVQDLLGTLAVKTSSLFTAYR